MYILGIVEKYKKTVKNTFEEKVKHFERSYSSFLALLERLYPDKIYSMIQRSIENLSNHGKYGVFYNHFVRTGHVDESRPILAFNTDFIDGRYGINEPVERFYAYNVRDLFETPILI